MFVEFDSLNNINSFAASITSQIDLLNHLKEEAITVSYPTTTTMDTNGNEN